MKNSSETSTPEKHPEMEKKILSLHNRLRFHFLIERKPVSANNPAPHLKHPPCLFSGSSLRSVPFASLPWSSRPGRLGFQDEALRAEDENLASHSLRRKLSSQSSSDQTSWRTSKNAWQVSPSLASIPSVCTHAESEKLVTLLN